MKFDMPWCIAKGLPGKTEFGARLMELLLRTDEKKLTNWTDDVTLLSPEYDETLYRIVEDDNYGDCREMYVTYFFPEFDLYIKLTGIYSSYGDSEWYEIKEVRPVERVVTFYE